MRYHDYTEWLNLPMTNEDIAEACEDAADLIEGNWARGSWETDTGARCIEGGLAAALGLDASDMDGCSPDRQLLRDCPVYNAVIDTLNLKCEEDIDYRWVDNGDLPTWNDSEETTEQQVLDVLHATAKRVLGVEA